MHRSAHLRRRHHRDRRGIHRHRRRVHHGLRRVHHGLRRDRHVRRPVHRGRWDEPSEQASHRDSGGEACCRGSGEDRPGPEPADRHLLHHRVPDALRHLDGAHRFRVPDESRDAPPERPSSRGCFRPSACEDLAWGQGRRLEPGDWPEPVPQKPQGPAGQPVQVPAQQARPDVPRGSEPVLRAQATIALREQPVPPERASARRASHLGSAHLGSVRLGCAHLESGHLGSAHLESADLGFGRLGSGHRSMPVRALPSGGSRPVWHLMVFLPGRCRPGTRRLRRERPSRGRTDEVDGPRGPLRSTTRI